MNARNFALVICLCACGIPAWAQTNTPASPPKEQKIDITSNGSYYDWGTNRLVYYGHVSVTDHVKIQLTCGWLAVDVPPEGEHPTNIVAETNVVVDVVMNGETNRVTSDQAVYSYSLETNQLAADKPPNGSALNIVTNEMITFTGGNPEPKVEGPHRVIWSDPLILDIARKKFIFKNVKMNLTAPPTSGGNTNSSPFNLFR